MPTPIIAAGITAAGGLLGGAGGGGSTQVAIPNDLKGMRSNNINLLNYLLFGQSGGAPTRTAPGGGGGQPTGQGFAPGGINASPGSGTPSGGAGGTGGFTPSSFGDLSSRIGAFFGPLGVPQSGLQQQSTDAISHFLASPGSENQAYDALAGILGQKPGQGIIDALKPSFDRNLASANQAGGRFSSGNEILRGNAVNDFNLLGAQAAQQGIQQQLAAAQAVDMLRQGQFNRLQGGYQTGSQQAAQSDLETQRRLQILMQLLGTSQSASLTPGTFQQPSPVASGIGTATDVASLLAALGIVHPSGGGGSVNAGGNTGGGSYG